MYTAVEQKEEISFNEFKAWMNGLVRGKGTDLPNLDDWRVIKQMMGKVVPDKEQVIQHTPIYTPQPSYTPPPQSVPWCDTQFIPSYSSGTAYGLSNLTGNIGTTTKLSISGDTTLKVSQIASKSE